MDKDFSFQIYRDLIEEINASGSRVFTLKEYFKHKGTTPKFIILRHDVDRRPENALEMAMLECSSGIHSSYYFRVNKKVFKKEIVQEIARLGHEIGYHYEVMDKAHGNIRAAKRIFERELHTMRTVTEVHTVCTHGNPLSRWDNRDFWKYFSLPQFDLLGEAYISVHDPDIYYATDTGRGWNRSQYNVKDTFLDSSVSLLPSLSTTKQLIDIIRTRGYAKIYLQIHPNRWCWRPLQWYRQVGEDLFLNWMKIVLAYYHKRK